MYKDDKDRYNNEIKNQEQFSKKETTNKVDVKEPEKKVKEKAKETKIKKPLKPYPAFIKSQFHKLNCDDAISGSKQLSVLWKGMTDEQKQPYFDMCKDDKERYQLEMNEQ